MQNNLAVHISDVHIFNTSRFQEQLEVFEELISITKKINPRFVSICGDLFHLPLILSGESYSLAKFLINELSKICKVIIIPGNHDVNLNNLKRKDGVKTLMEEVDDKKVFYYKDSGIYEFEDDIAIGVFSIIDKQYPKAPTTNKKKIALYHGTISGSKNYHGFEFNNAKDTIKIFDGWDIAMLGDIHQMQYLDKEKRIAYSGSLKQMDIGEDINKGILVWDLDNFSSTFIKIKNNYSFHKIFENDSIEKLNFTKNVHIVYETNKKLTQVEKNNIEKSVIDRATDLNSNILSFKINDKSTEDLISYTEDIENIYNLNVQLELLKEFLEQKKYNKNIIDKCLELHNEIFNDLPNLNLSVSSWTIEEIEFENVFLFQGKNKINFKNFNGLLGIFGKNAHGKSSIFSSIKYAIWGDSTNKSDLKNILNLFSEDAKTKIILNIDNVRYEIIRKIKKNKSGVYSSSVSINNLSNPDDTLCKGNKNEIKDFLNKTFGTALEFHNTAFSSQFQIHNIVYTKPAPRKQLFIDFLGLNIFSEFLKPIKNNFSNLEYKLRTFSKEKILNEYNEIQKSIKNDSPIIEKKIETINLLKDSIENLNETITTKKLLKKDIKDIDYSEEQLKKEINVLKQNIEDNLNEIKSLKLSEKIENIDKEQINGLNKKLKETKSQKELINEKISKLKSEIKILENKIESFQIDLKIIDKQSWFRDNELCQKCDFLSNAFEADKKLPITKDLIEKNKNEISSLLEELNSIKNKEEQIENVLYDVNQIVEKNNEILLHQNRNKLLMEKNENNNFKINDLENKIKNIKDNFENIEKNKKLDNEINDLNVELNNKKNLLNKESNEVDKIKIDLKFNSEKLIQINENLEEIEKNQEQFDIYSAYSVAMEREGLPKMIMLKYINIVNQYANKIISEVDSWRILLKSVEDNLEILVEEDSGFITEADQNSSGMQVTLIGLALRVALLKISQKTKCRLLFLDEPLGSLDNEKVLRIEGAFNYLKTLFPLTLMISHVPIYDICDHIILVEKVNNTTKLIIN